MITFFTTAKDFAGRTAVHQYNAIRSWKASTSSAEVIVFGECAGVEEARKRLGFIHVPEVETSDQGTPFINDMFDRIGRIAAHEICCYVNADILLSPKFSRGLATIHKLTGTGYLAVGQRQDVDLDEEIWFDSGWEAEMEDFCSLSGRIHPPSGSDFFAFPRGQYRKEDIPGLLVGRAGWDLWMIVNGRKRKFRVIDLSREVLAVHQNHDYSHRIVAFTEYGHDEEALRNMGYLPSGDKQDFTLNACNYYLEGGKIRVNFARGDWKRFFSIELNLRGDNMIFHFLKKVFYRLDLVY